MVLMMSMLEGETGSAKERGNAEPCYSLMVIDVPVGRKSRRSLST